MSVSDIKDRGKIRNELSGAVADLCAKHGITSWMFNFALDEDLATLDKTNRVHFFSSKVNTNKSYLNTVVTQYSETLQGL